MIPSPLLCAPPVSFMAGFYGENHRFCIEFPYVKQSLLNRYRLSGPNGIIVLTVPVIKPKGLPFDKVKIAYDEPWQKDHWRTITSCYNSSPFFQYYDYLFEPLYSNRPEHLWEFNRDMISAILRALRAVTDLRLDNEPHDPAACTKYADKKPHPAADNFPEYQQVFAYGRPFIPDLSILDALFNLGPETGDYLNEVRKIIAPG